VSLLLAKLFTLTEGEHLSDKEGNSIEDSTVSELRDKISNDSVTARQVIASYLARIGKVETEIAAWEAFDLDFIEDQLRQLEKAPPGQSSLLFGIPVGIKDIFNTKNLPTSYGSKIYEDNQPVTDCTVVAQLRAQGAVIMGKTVSTEFAYWKAGPTRNPLNTRHTPGGSSSGSAAAVSAGMVPLAVGSQTAGSTIRPASYCGIVGFKPSIGLISLAGVKSLSNSMDTVGVFGKSVADVALLAGVLSEIYSLTDLSKPIISPKIALLRAPEWDMADDSAIQAVIDAVKIIESLGSPIRRGEVPREFTPLASVQTRIMAREAARELTHERLYNKAQLSSSLLELFEFADSISSDVYLSDRKIRDSCIAKLDDLFGGADILLAPSSLSTAPLIEEGTGSPELSRAWTMLGLPIITIPLTRDSNGLPFGLQIASRPNLDHYLLKAAAWLESLLSRKT